MILKHVCSVEKSAPTSHGSIAGIRFIIKMTDLKATENQCHGFGDCVTVGFHIDNTKY